MAPQFPWVGPLFRAHWARVVPGLVIPVVSVPIGTLLSAVDNFHLRLNLCHDGNLFETFVVRIGNGRIIEMVANQELGT